MACGNGGFISPREYRVRWCNGAVFAPSRVDECSLFRSVEALLELMLDSEADIFETEYECNENAWNQGFVLAPTPRLVPTE